MIELRNLEKTFRTANGPIVALKNINLTIENGEIFGIIGLSGAGKSTVLKAILGQREYDGVIAFSTPGIRHRRAPRIG